MDKDRFFTFKSFFRNKRKDASFIFEQAKVLQEKL